MIPVGIASSSNITVGNNIGLGKVKVARYYAKICALTALICALISVALMNLMRPSFISMFTSSEIVNNIVNEAYTLLSFFVFFNCLQGIATGIIRGLGKQGLASAGTVCATDILVFKWEIHSKLGNLSILPLPAYNLK